MTLRRKLRSGKGTFNRIMANLESLVERWDGSVAIRVAVDKANQAHYGEFYRWLSSKFDGKKVKIRPANICDSPAGHLELKDHLNMWETLSFHKSLFYRFGIYNAGFHPTIVSALCLATDLNSYIVGPEGELYKCPNTIGIKEQIVGHIHKEKKDWNQELLARFMVEADPFHNPVCRECSFFPVCDMTCAERITKKGCWLS